MNSQYQVAIIGGGIGGLIAANCLAGFGINVCLIERKVFPFHRVCGEYVSNETRNFLKSLNLFPGIFNPPEINQFNLTSVKGHTARATLESGGFGISRYSFDNYLFERAGENGAKVFTGNRVENIFFRENSFHLSIHGGGEIDAEVVIGAFGKRSNLDKKLDRSFLQRSSPYIGVKYHINYEIPANEISLHNFRGGYCGISSVENNLVNLCYLSERANLKESGSIQRMERNYLCENPHLKKIWQDAEFVFKDPVVINEINFESKEPVENHILMVGDSAGMITPLCGNGIAMAIHSAKIASEEILKYFNSGKKSRASLETSYFRRWKNQFATRLAIGRNLQKMFGKVYLSNAAVGLLKNLKPVGRFLISKTHGPEF